VIAGPLPETPLRNAPGKSSVATDDFAGRSGARFDRGAFAVGLAGFCAFLDLYATQSLLPLLARTFHASLLEVSATVSATTIAVALGAPIIGPLAESFDRKRVIVGAALALSLPTFLCATAASLHQLIAFRFLQGLCMPAIFAVTIAYVSEEWTGRGVGRAMAGYVTGNIIGGVTGRVISGWVAAHHGWQGSFAVLGCLNVVAAAALFSLLPRPRRVRERTVRASLGGVLRHLGDKRLIAAYAVGFNVLFSIVATFTYVNFHLAAPPFRLGTVALGSVFFVYLAGVVATPVAGRWLGRWGYRAVFAASMAAAIAGMLLTMVPRLVVVLVGLSLAAAAIFVCQSAAHSYVGAAAGKERSAVAGIYVGFYYMGGTVGALVPAFVWRAGGWPACVLFIVVVQVMTIGIALFFWQNEEAQEPTAPHG
jgi:predicted MFS family arabinose efflux permease